MANNYLQFQLQQKNPPVPPQAVALASDPVPIEVRRLRVANGSRRKRDLAAVRMADELRLLETVGQGGTEVTDCWAEAKDRVRASVPPSTFDLWIEPLRPIGATGTQILLSAPEGIRAWTERRYSGLIREALSGSPFDAVEFVGEVEPCR
jgi:DnaA N-terminal domain